MTSAVMTEAYSQLAAACEVQQRFMQQRELAVDTLSYSAQCRQLDELGGDCYGFVQLTEDRVGLAIGDASGKGLPAALMISGVQASLRTAASFTGGDPAAVLEAVNRQVHASSLPSRYATLFYGVFNGETRTLQYANAGHNPPIVIRRDGSVACLETGGVPLGLFAEWTCAEGTMRLYPGDVVVAYTDDVVEATDSAGAEWGIEGLQKAASAADADCADELVRAIFAALDAFTHGHPIDDATVVVLRVH
jgi:sigma-B regulation protein RsbU (phosphoserine phosphatase)